MIAGWSTGEYVPDQGQFLIRDRNRHGWTQIFAPPYGWIDIEVTPGRPAVPRNILVPTTPTSGIPPGLPGSAEFDPTTSNTLKIWTNSHYLNKNFDAADDSNLPDPTTDYSHSKYPSYPTAIAASVVLLILLAVVLWRWNLRGQPPPIRAYSQFIRVAAILGYRKPAHQSAREFATQIADMTMRYADARRIIEAFEKSVYGPTQTNHETPINESPIETTSTTPQEETTTHHTNQTPTPETPTPNLSQSWRNLARAMLKHRIMTLVGMTPAYIPDETQQQHRFTT